MKAMNVCGCFGEPAPSNQSARARILDAAKDRVCNDRNGKYGEPEDCFETIAQHWSVYLGKTISAADVCAMMALLKIARIKNGTDTLDSYVDLAGYAACGGELVEYGKKTRQ